MGKNSTIKMMDNKINDLIVTMQAAHIEWKHGDGADAAMRWIENTLFGPGLIPDETEPYAKQAQAYFDENQSHLIGQQKEAKNNE